MLKQRKLPPLNAVKSFEAAARTGSVSLAAVELSVSASAVSQQIKGLEQWLGIKLLDRGPNSFALTEKGEEYLKQLTVILDNLDDLTTSLTGQDKKKLRISTLQSFAAEWLFPRIKKFRVFVLEIDNLGNEVNVKFPVQDELLLDFTNIKADDYALMTTKIKGKSNEDNVSFKDLKTYKYNTTSFDLVAGDSTTVGNDYFIIGKSIQKIDENIIITAINSGMGLNKALIYKLDLDLKLVWENEYYYSETDINRLNIGNKLYL